MSITHTRIGDYYIFSHEPNTRVYLGDAAPNDYIWDELEQQKRSASSWYKEIHSGKEITWDDIMNYKHDGSLPGNGLVFYDEGEWCKRENYTFEGGCTHNFERKLSLGGMGKLGGESCKYNQKDKAAEKAAWCFFFNQTSEEYDARQEENRLQREKQKRDNPGMHNLMMVSGESYYVDDDNNRITMEEHVKKMKEELGEDCFELANARIRELYPEGAKITDELYKLREQEREGH